MIIVLVCPKCHCQDVREIKKSDNEWIEQCQKCKWEGKTSALVRMAI